MHGEDDPIVPAYRRLCSHLGRPRWLQSVGVGDRRFVVYLNRALFPFEGPVPAEWEGYPVETVVAGRLRML